MKQLTELSPLLQKRRQALSLTQKDMLMRIGMSQQQYQRIEAGADLRVSTLLRILEGMGLELMLVPHERVREVERLLEPTEGASAETGRAGEDNPETSRWSSVLDDLEDS